MLFALPFVGDLVSVATVSAGYSDDLGELILFVSFVILAVLLLHASVNVPGKRTPWDRGSGTMVRYRGRQR